MKPRHGTLDCPRHYPNQVTGKDGNLRTFVDGGSDTGMTVRVAAGILGLALGYQGTSIAHDAILSGNGIKGGSITPVTALAPATARTFSNCSAARAAGAAPMHRGEPAYSPHLDRDGDGVACE